MRRLFYLSTLLFLVLFSSTAFSVEQITASPLSVKVLIKENAQGALLEVKGKYEISDPSNGKILSTGSRGKRFYVLPHSEGVKWGEGFPGVYQIRVTPVEKDGAILLDGIQYRGSVEIYHIDDLIHVINDVDVEHFMKSTLTRSIGFQPIEGAAMEALAVTCRTNIYHHLRANQSAFWHYRKEEVQYEGAGKERLHALIDESIDSTRCTVMTYKNQTFPTSWNDDCAGQTASYQAIFRKESQAPEGVCSLIAQRNREASKWNYSIDISKLLSSMELTDVKNVELFLDPQSNKTYAIRFQDGNEQQVIPFTLLQDQLGTANIKSNDFSVHLSNHRLVFEGYGKGNGVGLCLYSANEMAKMGDSPRKILSSFYPSTTLHRVDSVTEARSSSS